MDNFVYNAFCNYFHTLETVGYASKKKMDSLLVLNFFYELMFNDYRGYISREDYRNIEKALNCLYGTNCLIPYPDYLKMGKLKLGEMTEVLSRIKASEEELDTVDKRILDNDALIADNVKRIDEYGTRLDNIDSHDHNVDEHLARHDQEIADHEARITANRADIDQHRTELNNHKDRLDGVDTRLDGHDNSLANHEDRIVAVESTKVIKGKNHIQNIPDIDLSQFDQIQD